MFIGKIQIKPKTQKAGDSGRGAIIMMFANPSMKSSLRI